MDTVNTPKRLPLGGLDANRRHTPTPSGSGKSSDENAVLGKRMAKEENQSESTGNTPNKKRKISDIRVPIVGEDKACDEVPIIEVNDYDFEEAEKGMEAGKIGDEVVNSTTNSSPMSSCESSQQTTIPQNSQETNITESDHNDNNGRQTRLLTAKQQAYALRLRLHLAMYKVHTNQTSVPLSRLEIRSSSFSNSSKNNQRSKLNLSAHPTSGTYPALKENSDGEALLVVGGGGRSTQESMSTSRPSNIHSNYQFNSGSPQTAKYKGGIESNTHAHPTLVPYASQKRKSSLSSASESSDAELEIPPRRVMPKNTECEKTTRFTSTDNVDRGCLEERRDDVSRGIDTGCSDHVVSDERVRDGISIAIDENDRRNVNGNGSVENDTDELDVAAGGLLELMSQGR